MQFYFFFTKFPHLGPQRIKKKKTKRESYQIPKAPMAKREVQVPQWSLGEMRGRLERDRAVKDRIELGLAVIKGGDRKVLEDEEDGDKWWGWAWIEVMMVDGIWREEKCERWNLELELELGVKTVGEGRCNIIAIVKQSLLRRARPLCQLGDSVD